MKRTVILILIASMLFAMTGCGLLSNNDAKDKATESSMENTENMENNSQEITDKDEVEIAVQLNGKVKDKIMLQSGLGKEQTEEAAMKDDKVKALLDGKEVVKVIAVPGKLVNIVVK